MHKILKKLIRKIFFVTANQRLTLYQSLLHIKKLGFNPNTIIDVGVAKGTKDSYKAFPRSFFFL